MLVAGGTGTLGTTLVRALLDHGDPVRVLTRDARRADHLRDAGAEVVVGDVRAAADLATAVRDCATVVSAVHGFVGPRGTSPASIDRDGNRGLIRAALDAGVEHLVLVSAYGAAPTHPMSLHRMKYAAEQSLIGSGLPWTIVRPVPFMETWIGVIGAHLADQGKALVPGPGDNPLNVVSVRDVATAVDRAVRDSALRGRIMDVTGPQNVTLRHIAERLVAGGPTPSRIVHVPLAALRVTAVLARPVAPAFARQARAAIVMTTTDMTAPAAGPEATTLDQLLSGRIAPTDSDVSAFVSWKRRSS